MTDLAPQTREMIEQLLIQGMQVSKIPVALQRLAKVRVARVDVQLIYAEIAVSKMGRKVANVRSSRLAIPDDFAVNAARESNHTLAERYGVSRRTVSGWRHESGLPDYSATNTTRKDMPADFKKVAVGLTNARAAEHYGVSWHTIKRWHAEAGTRPAGQFYAGRLGMRNRGGNYLSQQGKAPLTRDHDGRDASRAGMAARFLQRTGPIWRCDAQGNPLPNGFFWKHCNRVISDDEVIERAERKGFDPDAWKRLPHERETARASD